MQSAKKKAHFSLFYLRISEKSCNFVAHCQNTNVMKHQVLKSSRLFSTAIIAVLMLCSAQVWGGVISFIGEDLDNNKTVGCVKLTTGDMTHTSNGLYASGSNKTFTLTATGAVITKIVITTNSTSERYQKANITSCSTCTRSDMTYTCTISPAVSTVNCKNNGGGVTVTRIDVTAVSEWILAGEFGASSAWKEEEMDATATGASVTMNLAANSRYQFKFKKGSDYYGNTGAIVSNINDWVFATDLDNCTLYTGPAGEYTFELNSTTKEVAVTYPTVSHPDPNYVYFIPGPTWDNARIYNWKYGSDPIEEASSWVGAPTITTQTSICGQSYYYCAAYFDYMKFRDNGSNASEDVLVERGKYLDERTHESACKPFATYTISFNAGGGEGTMSAISGICPGGEQAIPANQFTKSGYLFDHWAADQDVMVGGSVITAGDAIAAGATIESVGTDIILTAQWRAKPAMFQYILGSCNVKNGVWTQGSDGSVSAWRYKTEDGNLMSTTDISYSNSTTGGVYFNSKDLSQLDDPNKWSASSGSNRAIKAFQISSNGTLTFGLKGLTAYRIAFYVFPGSNNAYSIDLTVNGVTENKPIAASQQNKWHKFEYDGSTYTGDLSIKSCNQQSRVVVIVEVPAVKISFDANGGSGTMNPMLVSEGDEVQLPENEFTRSGYRFLGWREDAGGTGALIADEGLYSTSADVTLYAQWIEIVHTTITLDATGAYNSYTTSVVASSGEPMPEITALPQRVGHVFNGYFSEPNGGGTQYYTGLGVGTQTWDQTAPAVTLYAHWLEPCDLVPTLAKMAPVVTIWDKQDVDMGVARLLCDFDTTGVSYDLVSASPAVPINGCSFEYFDEQIHLMGMPNRGNSTTETVNVTLTMANNCSPSTSFDITITIRIYPEGQKPKIAFIVTGTEKNSIAAGGNFDAYNTGDKTACNDLLTYLGTFYDVTCVNGYATKDEAEIAAYYEQYDLLVVTDFLQTGKGYTNKLGTLIDKKPILSFEAYVANQSNWHIGSNPKDPSPKVKTMKILCAGHAIFKDAENVDVYNEADTTVQVLSTLSSESDAKGLQGFTINEAPDFIFLATIRDTANSRDLVVCCERQIVFSARLLIYGINFYEMGGLSPAGRVVMHQMIDYLLMTDETKIADCSLVFDNHNGTGIWSDAANWAPGYNIIPTPYHPTRIAAVCNVDIDDAHAGSVKINQGRNGTPDGKLIIKPYGGLTVAGIVTKVNDTRYASPTTIKSGDLLIEADATHNGAFVYGNKESDVSARVEYYSRGEGAPDSPVWQYIGIPTRSGKTAISMYREAWMCRWETAGTMGGLWQWVANEDVLLPFEGYAITQAAQKKYTLEGKLNLPVTRTLDLNHRDDEGYAFAANSWTAPIKIQELQDADFTNAEKAIYIYHSGTYAAWDTNKATIINSDESAAAPNPGQYAVIPIHSAPYLGADSVIPAMQGFFVKTTGSDAKLKLVYNRVVYDATYFRTSTQPMRAPRRAAAQKEGPDVMKLNISGDTYGDRIYLISQNGFSEGFEDGWDGRKIEGDVNAPRLAVIKEAGEMAVAAVESFEERNLSFRAGSDSEYTFSFEYAGETIYLYDRVTGQATEIKTGNTYSFTATNSTPVNRFLITTDPPQLATGLEPVSDASLTGGEGARKVLFQNKLYILHGGRVYDAQGARVSRKEGVR